MIRLRFWAWVVSFAQHRMRLALVAVQQTKRYQDGLATFQTDWETAHPKKK